MAILIADGFDFYNNSNITDATYTGSPWTTFAFGVNSGTYAGGQYTPYGIGQSASYSTGTLTSVQWSTNESTVFIHHDYMQTSTYSGSSSNGHFITLNDTTNAQVTLQWGNDGNFYVRTGGTGGTVVGGPWAHGMAPNSWCNWQAKVVISNTAGSVELRKNNNSVDDFSITNINTRGGSTNNYANKYVSTTGGLPGYIDNLFVNSATTPVPISWSGQLKCVQLMPNGNTGTINLTTSVGTSTVVGINSTLTNYSVGANTIYFGPQSFNMVGGNVSQLTLKLNASMTGHMTCALYTDNAGVPGSLVAQTIQITNPAAGDNNFTFSSPPVVSDNTPYWFAFWADAAPSVNADNSGATGRLQALTYTGTFPSTVTTTTSGGVFGGVPSNRATITPVFNYSMVNENAENGDTDYVFGSVAGNVDLYTLQPLTTIPASIAAVVVRNLMRKSDSGARTATTEVNSGGTVVDQTAVNLAVTYGWQNTYFAVDPNTSAAWTYAAVNAFQVGPKIVT